MVSYQMQKKRYDVVTIGAGAAGLVTSIGCAALGRKSALIEAHLMGGDCTNYGCIPSKALIAAAKSAHNMRNAGRFSLGAGCDAEVDFGAVMRRVRSIVDSVREHESPEVMKERGVDVFMGKGVFRSPHEIEVHSGGGVSAVIEAANVVIATGSHPFIPPIPGIDGTDMLTNEDIFQIEARPDRLIVIGGGPIGCEIGQSMNRLGSKVTMIEAGPRILPKEDDSTSELVRGLLSGEGMEVITGANISELKKEGGEVVALYETAGGGRGEARADAVFVSAGRRANTLGMNLEAAGVGTERGTVKVNEYFQTSRPHIFACGDCTGGLLFTHVAEAEAKVVVRNILFPYIKSKMDYRVTPWTTFLDPEIAHAGLLKIDAEKKHGAGKIHVYRYELSDLDRAITESENAGFIEVVTMKWSGKILGATIVASRAGEMMSEICLAMKHGIPVYRLSGLIHAYPTFTLGVRKAADLYFVETLAEGVKNLKKKLWPFTPSDRNEPPRTEQPGAGDE